MLDMNTATRAKIGGALTAHPEGLTRAQLIGMTGLSAATVGNAIQQLRLTVERTERPYRYRLNPDTLSTPTLDKSIVPPMPNAVPRWNAARERFARDIVSLELTPDADPRHLAQAFESGGTNLLSVAAALREADGPDWYTRLGGTLETDLDTPDETGG